ncbi:MAG: dihydrodipicolinate synthase family protein [Acidobacteria bacterium]|nr:dihydrodipicolinate synthase family protein [Acidobacteriota bacterium]
MRSFSIDGVIPVIPTPFDPDEQVDWDALCRLVDFACVSGASALCLPAYASEFYKLNDEERQRAIAEAVDQVAGRVPVIGQVNAASARAAAETAHRIATLGADAVGITIPRIFPTGEDAVEKYLETVLSAVALPAIIQDFNPGGPTISTALIARLNRRFPHFRYVKLEEAMMAPKIAGIIQETEGRVGVLEGWGGMYMIELHAAGICGVVPGLGVSDLLGVVYRHLKSGAKPEAYRVFQSVLPQIVFSLQNIEFFHHAEKRLLVARGLLESATVRQLTLEPSPNDDAHIDFLNQQILEALDTVGLPRNPEQEVFN